MNNNFIAIRHLSDFASAEYVVPYACPLPVQKMVCLALATIGDDAYGYVKNFYVLSENSRQLTVGERYRGLYVDDGNDKSVFCWNDQCKMVWLHRTNLTTKIR